MRLKTGHKKAKRKERYWKFLVRIFPGLNGREIEKEIEAAFGADNRLDRLRGGRPYRSRRNQFAPVEQDTRPVPF